MTVDAKIDRVYQTIRARDPSQKEFLQAVQEVLISLKPLFAKYPHYLEIVPALCEPERIIQFRVPWVNDAGVQQVNRGFRVQFSQTLGPYKGGLRFHPSVNESIIKFLGFEQILKNALTGLPMGGGKGGSDFDPKGKSDLEVKRFTESFMTELSRHIGQDTDVPAGDIGVGGREIGFMFGQWKRMRGTHEGVLTGKGASWGGSKIRPEATGYGCVYSAEFALANAGQSLKGKRVVISGSGNVAQFAAEKLLELGASVLTLSDSSGFIYEPKGFTRAQLDQVVAIKTRRGRCSEYRSTSGGKYVAGARPWAVAQYDIAMPCATQNEIEIKDAPGLINNGCKWVFEGANMPTTNEAIDRLRDAHVSLYPAKAANAGGVAVSGLEMSQNSLRLGWSREEVDGRLKDIMKNIFENVKNTAADLGRPGDFQLGANAAGFVKVADAMIQQGQVFIRKSKL